MEETNLMDETVKKWGVAIAWVKGASERCAKAVPWAKPLSPTNAPTPWNIINGICCLGTGIFLLLGLLAPSQSQSYAFAELCYVPFNLVICIFWLAEAALWMLFDQEEPVWQKTGELALAGYFIVDGFVYCYEWWVLETPPKPWEIIVYTAIDMVMYLYYFVAGFYPDALANFVPSNPRELIRLPSYKQAVSIARRFIVWWLPTLVTLVWMSKHRSHTWNYYSELFLLSAGTRGSMLFLETSMDV